MTYCLRNYTVVEVGETGGRLLIDLVALDDIDYEEDHEGYEDEGQDGIQEVPDPEGLAAKMTLGGSMSLGICGLPG